MFHDSLCYSLLLSLPSLSFAFTEFSSMCFCLNNSLIIHSNNYISNSIVNIPMIILLIIIMIIIACIMLYYFFSIISTSRTMKRVIMIVIRKEIAYLFQVTMCLLIPATDKNAFEASTKYRKKSFKIF